MESLFWEGNRLSKYYFALYVNLMLYAIVSRYISFCRDDKKYHLAWKCFPIVNMKLFLLVLSAVILIDGALGCSDYWTDPSQMSARSSGTLPGPQWTHFFNVVPPLILELNIFLAPGGPDHQNMALHTMGKLGQSRFFMFSYLTLQSWPKSGCGGP